MQIPRKIYYDLATGNVLQDTGEHSGDLIETTLEQDFSIYLSLQSRTQDSVGCMYLEYGQFAEQFSQGSYRINITTTPHSISWGYLSELALEDYKESYINQLNEQCNASILGTFLSSALGEEHVYILDMEAQMNFAGTKLGFNDNMMTQIDWNTRDAGVLIHTESQFNQLWIDGFMHKVSNIEKYRGLKEQVESATTIEEVNLIVW